MTRKPAEALSRFWATDRGLSILLGFLVVAVFLLPLLRDVGPLRRVVRDVIISLLLISGAGAVYERRPTFLVISVVATAALLVRWVSWLTPSDVLEQWRAVSLLTSLGLLSLVVLAQVFRKGPVTLHRIQGAIAVYLLLGLTWGFAYELLALRQPGAFAGPGVEVAASETWQYYSFVTLTTVGYGDVTPIHAGARSLAMLEALTGQLYPAILLARLVSLEVESRRQG
jgi:Ion channel